MKPTEAWAIVQRATGLPASSHGQAHVYVSRADAEDAYRRGGSPMQLMVQRVGIFAVSPDEAL